MTWQNVFESLHRPAVNADHVQQLGAMGLDVVIAQRQLNRLGHQYGVSVEVTGLYDEQTRLGVRRFQQLALKVPFADGYIGPLTAKKLHLRLVGDFL